MAIQHGASNGTPGSVHTWWLKDDPDYDELISEMITASRWTQLKSVFKLNHNVMADKKGMEGYDPSSKYDHIYLALVHHMNYCTVEADLDGGLDESTWGFSGFCGDTRWRLKNKPKSKG